METDSIQCNLSCGGLSAEIEGKGVVGSDGDLGDHGAIAHREGKESGGDSVDDSFVVVNRDPGELAEGDLDLEIKLDLEAENDVAVSNVGSAPEVAVVGGREASNGESDVEIDSNANCGFREDEKLSVEKQFNEGSCEDDDDKESGTNVEANGESRMENGNFFHKGDEEGEEEEKLGAEEVSSDVGVKGIDHHEELEVAVEEKKEPEAVVEETSQQDGEMVSAMEAEEDQGFEIVDTETNLQEEWEPIVAEKQEPKPVVAEIDPEEEEEDLKPVIDLDDAEPENQRGPQPDIEVEKKQEPETDAVAAADDVDESESASEVEEKEQPHSDITEVDNQEEMEPVPKTNSFGESESFEIDENLESQGSVAQTEEGMKLQYVETQQEQQLCGVKVADDDQEEPESVVHVEGEQHNEVVVPETVEEEEQFKSVTDVEAQQKPEMLIKGGDDRPHLESAVDVDFKQEPETVVAESENHEVTEKGEPENLVVKVEVLEGDEDPVVEAEVLKGDENLVVEAKVLEGDENPVIDAEVLEEDEKLIVEAEVLEGEENRDLGTVTEEETVVFQSLPVENGFAGTSNGDDDCPREHSEVNGDTPLEVRDAKESSKGGESGSTCIFDDMGTTTEQSGGCFGNGVIVADEVDNQTENKATTNPPKSSNSPRSSHADDKESANGAPCSLDIKSGNNGVTVPFETKVDIPSAPVDDIDSGRELVDACVKNRLEIENDLVESGVNNNTDLKDVVCNGIADPNKDDYVGEKILKSQVSDGECITSSMEEDGSTSKEDDEEPSCKEVGVLDIIQTPCKEPSDLALDEERREPQTIKGQPCFIIRVPRFSDDELKIKLWHAKMQLDEKSQSKESIKDELQRKRVTVDKCEEERAAAKEKVNDVRAGFNAKRQELESAQSKINKVKDASSINEIDAKIHGMEYELQHNTIPLTQEKHYIHEIKQLKQIRRKLSSTMPPAEEVQEAFDQRDEVEERVKILKKELSSCRSSLVQAESDRKDSRKRFDVELEIQKELQGQARVADVLRQDAFAHFQSIREKIAEKCKYFAMYKEDQQIVSNYLFSGDREGLQSYCSKQVERVMDLWNNNEEFRREYVKSNENSTLRRFRTLDGRSLGSNEDPPVLRTIVDRGSTFPPLPLSKVTAPGLVPVSRVEPKPAKQTDKPANPKRVVDPRGGAIKDSVSSIEEVKEEEKETKVTKEAEEEARKTEEKARKDEEKARKEDELRKEKAAAEMKERCRMEQKAKAKEAEERKKRMAEKAQAKAEYKAKKETELREKKRAKKEKKKAASVNGPEGGIEGGNTPTTDVSPTETADVAAPKPSSRSRPAVKQYIKAQPLPMPLRNRGKRKMQAWMWVALSIVLLFTLFLAGNYISPFNFGLQGYLGF